MKNNQPVTQRERTVPPGEILVSQTDLRGVTTYANSTFVEVSGYTADELVGSSHNLVRHPDVPPRVFEAMWDTLHRGQIWHGVLKNRSKDGDHYWVDSLVMPILKEGVVSGYMSVRRQAQRKDIAAAERQYERLAAGGTHGLRPQGFRLDRWLSIRSGVRLGIAFIMVLLLVGAAVGLVTMNRAERAMDDIQREAVDVGGALERIKFLMADNRAQIMLGALHDPRNPLSATHDHPLSAHLDRLAKSRENIDALWATLRSQLAPGRAAELADQYWAARRLYVEEGLLPASRALAAADYAEANRRIIHQVIPRYDEANAQADELLSQLQQASARRIDDERALYARLRHWTAGSIVAVLLALSTAGALFLRGVVKPVEARIDDLMRMAEGNLTARIDVEGHGEIGRLNRAFAATQAQLQCLLDHLSRDATQVSAESVRLKALTLRLNDGIDEQHGRIFRIADRVAEMTATAAALVQRSEGFMVECARIAPTIERRSDTDLAVVAESAVFTGRHLAETAFDMAAETRVLTLLGGEVERDARRIAAFLVDHREAMHALWWAAGKLTAAAADMEMSANHFEIG